MKYMGSKARIAHELLPIILKDRKPNQWYVEPFVGGANMIDKVDGNRIGADTNKYLIALFVELQNGWNPPRYVTEEHYLEVKNNFDKFEDYHIAYIGFCFTFGAGWFNTFVGDTGKGRDRIGESYRNIIKTKKNVHGIDFYHSNYSDLNIPSDSIIYCDPPYKGTSEYKGVDKFSHDLFWKWVRLKESEGQQVFISEYQAPDDFYCIWEGQVSNTLSSKGNNLKPVEKLFTLNPRVKLPPKQPCLF